VPKHRRMSWLAGALALVALSQAWPGIAGESAPLAPGFTVRALDGRSVRLSDYKGKAVVLDFWATWCAPCRASLPHLNEVQGRFSKQGLVVLGISVDDAEPAEVRQFADKLGLKFRMAMADERVLDLYGPIRTIPTTFFINRKGEVTRRVVGYIDSETLEGYVKELF
jgi:peroxiredoxin